MRVIRWIFKVLLCPVILCGKLLQWVGIFISCMSSWIFHLAAGLLFTLALVCVIFQVAERSQTIQALGFSFAIFILPHLFDWGVDRIADVNDALIRFMYS